MLHSRPLLSAAAMVLAACLGSAPALAQGANQIVIYNKGKVLHFDPDVGAELKEVILETYDCGSGELVKKETIEAYFHLSDDREIITPDAITDACHAVFKIEKKGDKYFFEGVRDKPVESQEEIAAAVEAAPPPTREESVRSIEEKVRRVAREIVKIDPAKKGSSVQRERIINAEFTTSLSGFDTGQLEQVTGYVRSERDMSTSQQYYVLRSFGFVFYRKADYPKAIFFYDKCTELLPDRYSAYLQKAVAQQKAGENDGAIRSYVTSLQIVSARGGRTADSVVRRFRKFLGDLTVTEKLGNAQMDDLRGRLEMVSTALKSSDTSGARSKADDLVALVDGWYAGGAAAPPPDVMPGDDDGF
jgi:tetratricopeptide (TPR) repeat protein